MATAVRPSGYRLHTYPVASTTAGMTGLAYSRRSACRLMRSGGASHRAYQCFCRRDGRSPLWCGVGAWPDVGGAGQDQLARASREAVEDHGIVGGDHGRGAGGADLGLARVIGFDPAALQRARSFEQPQASTRSWIGRGVGRERDRCVVEDGAATATASIGGLTERALALEGATALSALAATALRGQTRVTSA
jgi:hypothetical protein